MDDKKHGVTQDFDKADNQAEDTANSNEGVVVLKDVATYADEEFLKTVQSIAEDVSGCMKVTQGRSDAYIELDPEKLAVKIKQALLAQGFNNRNAIVAVEPRGKAEQLIAPCADHLDTPEAST